MEKKTKGFLRILQRYMDGSSRNEEKQVMDIWYGSIERENISDLDSEDKNQLEDKIWAGIQKEIYFKNEPEAVSNKLRYIPYLKFVSAASVLLVLGFLYFISDLNRSRSSLFKNISSQEQAALLKIENTGSSQSVIRLTDGSHVTLEKGAKLYYPKLFSATSRKVYLEGNAFFNISKNPQKPFLVFSGDIVTKVLGTSFTVHTNIKSGNIEVAVLTGKVIVEKADKVKETFDAGTGGVFLTPNKKVIFLPESEKYITGIVDKPVFVEKPDAGAFVFEETSLIDVIEKLEKAYGVEIKLENGSIAHCPITADLSNESLFVKLEIINALLNTKSQVRDTTILLTGGACNSFKSSQT
ncbi:FecR family protein [Dyadobacter sp. CY345]|nr:FecR family protein [Dyadobacter sp. CY345]